MLNFLIVIDINPEASQLLEAEILAVLQKSAHGLRGVKSSRVGKTLPRSLNGGQILWRVEFSTEAEFWHCLSSPPWQTVIEPALSPGRGILTDRVAYRVAFSGDEQREGRTGIWRFLLRAIEPYATKADFQIIERNAHLMPSHVSAIRSWASGNVIWAAGRRRWSHIVEQEFDSVAGLEGEYMSHPVHWGYVDGFYDPESPTRIFDPFLIHAAMSIDEPIIS
jgi:hypothetical protein